MTRAFLRGKVEKGFSLGQETLAASMFFTMKDCERTPSNFLYHVKKELSSPGLLREF